MEYATLDDLINEIVRLQGTDQNIDNTLKELIPQIVPLYTSADIAKECMDEKGNFILVRLVKYAHMFAPELVSIMRELNTWEEFKQVHNLVDLPKKIRFDKALELFLKK